MYVCTYIYACATNIRRKTTLKDQVIRLKEEGGKLTRNDQEVFEELSMRFRKVFSENLLELYNKVN